MRDQIKQPGNGAKKLLILLFVFVVIFWISFCLGTGDVETGTENSARAFTLILWSILLEALPFVLLGTIISSLIQVFVSEDTILKILPKNNTLRLIFASLLGIIFPVCECAIIPITRGLIKKGMPLAPAIAFMIATPIVNPIVLLSTYNAFPTMPEMVIYRGIFGFAGALLIGFLVGRAEKKVVLKKNSVKPACSCGHDHHQHSHETKHVHNEKSCSHSHDNNRSVKRSIKSTFKEIIAHTNIELKSVGMYLIFGALIASCMQIVVPKDLLFSIGSGRISSILVMMLLAFVLSLCSEADAFIASTFLLHFSGASILAFLITGPMIDIKNTMMLLGSFKKKFVFKLILIILLICFVLALIASFIMGGAYE